MKGVVCVGVGERKDLGAWVESEWVVCEFVEGYVVIQLFL